MSLSSWTAVTVGVADLDQALALWVDDFGFEIAKRRAGPDPALARLWSVESGDIGRQALVRTPGARYGMLHLVEFAEPGPPVRADASAFDSVPKNLDVYVRDMPARLRALLDSGRQFRNTDFSEVTAPNGVTFREMHLPGHDEINVVLLEILGGAMAQPPGDFAGVGPLILIVDDAEAETAFYQTVLGLDVLSHNVLAGEEIERMIGLPAGTELDVRILGHAGHPFGQIEIIDYRGVEGQNLYPLARPKSRGILHVSYLTESLSELRRSLKSASVDYVEYTDVATPYSEGNAVAVRTPAGFRIEFHAAVRN